MLRFACKPDNVFQALVTDSLEYAIEDFALDNDPTGWHESWSERLPRLFSPHNLLREMKRLLDAHRSKSLFMPTDYHFLILYEVVEKFCLLHNDWVFDECHLLKKQRFFRKFNVRLIDFDRLQDFYFWDDDFLWPEELVGSIEQRNQVGLNEEVFSIAHGLMPHPDELVLKEHSKIDIQHVDWDGPIFVDGRDYPYDYHDFRANNVKLREHSLSKLILVESERQSKRIFKKRWYLRSLEYETDGKSDGELVGYTSTGKLSEAKIVRREDALKIQSEIKEFSDVRLSITPYVTERLRRQSRSSSSRRIATNL